MSFILIGFEPLCHDEPKIVMAEEPETSTEEQQDVCLYFPDPGLLHNHHTIQAYL
jgi:hypothetical protein